MIKLSLLACFSSTVSVNAQDPWKDVYSRNNWEQRDSWQRPDEILAFLNLQKNSVVADIGCHEGYFSFKLAKKVSDGIVYAVDISERRLEKLRTIAGENDIRNVEAILGESGDPRLPASVDAILIVDTYHEIKNPIQFLKTLLGSMKAKARIVICEPIGDERRGASRETQFRRHELESAFAIQDLAAAGFRLVAVHEDFVDRRKEKGDQMWVIVAEKP